MPRGVKNRSKTFFIPGSAPSPGSLFYMKQIAELMRNVTTTLLRRYCL